MISIRVTADLYPPGPTGKRGFKVKNNTNQNDTKPTKLKRWFIGAIGTIIVGLAAAWVINFLGPKEHVPPYMECEPKDSVSDPKKVAYTLGLIYGGAYDDQPDLKELALHNMRKELCGPLVARDYKATEVYKMTAAALMDAATKEGLL